MTRGFPIPGRRAALPERARWCDGPRDEALAQAVVALARSLRLEVIAEGVEVEAQLRKLEEMGCDLGQGFLVSPPVPADELWRVAERQPVASAA